LEQSIGILPKNRKTKIQRSLTILSSPIKPTKQNLAPEKPQNLACYIISDEMALDTIYFDDMEDCGLLLPKIESKSKLNNELKPELYLGAQNTLFQFR
jgi:hypothetical protein